MHVSQLTTILAPKFR